MTPLRQRSADNKASSEPIEDDDATVVVANASLATDADNAVDDDTIIGAVLPKDEPNDETIAIAVDDDATQAIAFAELAPDQQKDIPATAPTDTQGPDETQTDDSLGQLANILIGNAKGEREGNRSALEYLRTFFGEENRPSEFESDLLGGFVADLIDEGVLRERKALSIALQARESGDTFLKVLATDTATADLPPIYDAIANRLGRPLIRRKSDLIARVEDVDWLSWSAAEQKGIMILQSDDPYTTYYASIDPWDLFTQDWVSRHTSKPAVAIAVLPDVFFDSIGRLKRRGETVAKSDDYFVPTDVKWVEDSGAISAKNIEDVPLIVDYILQKAQQNGASDVHVEPTEDGTLVRTRVDGMLQEDARLPIELHPALTSRIKILGKMDVAEKRRPQDGRITALIRGAPLDIRVSSFPTVLGEKIALRLLDEEALRPTPEKLGMRENNLRIVLDKIIAPHGLIFLSGPTGSGKTTTLYSCLSAADRSRRNVVTIEDPVEYRLKGVHQMQVNDKIGLTFASGLRTILRQDPDVIMVGECRDLETTNLAIQASLTGHVVFSTIHANDAIGVVNRLLDMSIDPFLVASALSLSISQRLLRSICPHCATPMEGREILNIMRSEGISAEKISSLGIEIDDHQSCLHPSGCSQCRHTGYTGRQAVFELLEIDEDVRQMIMASQFNADELRAHAARSGMTTIVQDALQLVADGRTTYFEVARVFGDGQ